MKTKVILPQSQVTLTDFGYPVQTLWFSCSQTLAILFRPFGFLAPRFWLSCLDPLVFLLPDFDYPVQTIWFSCSQILTILFRPFAFLAPRLWLSCLYPLVFLLPDFGTRHAIVKQHKFVHTDFFHADKTIQANKHHNPKFTISRLLYYSRL